LECIANRDNKSSTSSSRSASKKSDDVANIPVEAIHCHICNLLKFSSKKAYLAHLGGSTHEEMARAFHSRNSALLQLLRSEVKMNSQRQIISSKISGDKVKLNQCFKCHCQILGSLQKHLNSVEHKLVNNFLVVKCCDIWFQERVEYEEHKLTLSHLLKTYESLAKKSSEDEVEKEIKEDDSEEDPVSKEEWASSTKSALMAIEFDEDLSTLDSLQPYSSEISTGKQFLQCEAVVHCSACNTKVDSSNIEAHTKSYDHYNKILAALKKEVSLLPLS